MPVNVRDSAVSPYNTNNNLQVQIPATAQVGDLMLLHAGGYNNSWTVPSGWTSIVHNAAGQNSYWQYGSLFYRIVQAGDAGTVVTMSGGNSTYSVLNLLVLYGHATTGFVDSSASNGSSGSPIQTPSFTVNATSQTFFFASQMTDGGSTPSFGVPSGFSQVVTTIPSSGGYQRGSAFKENSMSSAGTHAAIVSSTDNSGGAVAIAVAIKEGNVAPSATNLSPNTFRDNRVATNFTWTYNDTEGNAQNAYQIQYRLKGSTGAWTTVTGTTGTSHTFAANTFTLGEEYEWQVRVSDAIAGYGVWSTLTYFVAGVSAWSYGPQVVTATQSGVIPGNHLKGEFEDTADINAWEANTIFGVYTAPESYVRSSVRAKTGTYSMEVTWPTGSASWVDQYIPFGLVQGQTYELEADVYIPTGSPDVRFLVYPVPADFVYDTSSGKDGWVKITGSFTAASDDYRVGIRTQNGQSPVSGNKAWFDNITLRNSLPVPGTYYVQVRTADDQDFGPWSASDTFVVNSPPNAPTNININPLRVGGSVNVTWTYSDTENDAQTKYQIQYRRKS